MPRLCKCGCGNNLRPGAVRDYLNGHNPNSRHRNSPKINRDTQVEERPYTPQDSNWLPDAQPDDPPRWTIDDAAAATPNDPDPSNEKPPDTPPPPPVDNKTLNDVYGKLTFYMEILAMPLMSLDPVCGPVMANNFPNIARKMTPILCQSPEVVKWFTKTGNFALYVDLAMACWPVVQIVIAHHLTKSVKRDDRQPLKDYNPHMYTTDA